MKPVPPSVRGETEHKVTFEDTLTYHDPQLPPVFSTPHMIGMMEVAAFQALQPYCEGDEITVGTAIDIEHRAPVAVGAHIKAEAVLESFDGRFYTLRVTAQSDDREISHGTVKRAVVSSGKFREKYRVPGTAHRAKADAH